MSIINTILNLIFPANCMVCNKAGYDICEACILDSPTTTRETEDWIFPMFDYRHVPIKKSVWLLKYKNRKNLAKIFAVVVYGHITEELSELSVMRNFVDPIIIPIPLSKKRKRERGYNQCELIIKEIMKLEKENGAPNKLIYGENILVKTRETERQAQLKDKSKRLKNLEGSFLVDPRINIKNRNIILIDDVVTTGTTLKEAKKALKKAGVKKIIAFTIAH